LALTDLDPAFGKVTTNRKILNILERLQEFIFFNFVISSEGILQNLKEYEIKRNFLGKIQ